MPKQLQSKTHTDTEAMDMLGEIHKRLNNLTAKQLLEFIAEADSLLGKIPEHNSAQ